MPVGSFAVWGGCLPALPSLDGCARVAGAEDKAHPARRTSYLRATANERLHLESDHSEDEQHSISRWAHRPSIAQSGSLGRLYQALGGHIVFFSVMLSFFLRPSFSCGFLVFPVLRGSFTRFYVYTSVTWIAGSQCASGFSNNFTGCRNHLAVLWIHLIVDCLNSLLLWLRFLLCAIRFLDFLLWCKFE